MPTSLLSNLPIEDLTPETDYLGLIEKGDLIKAFLVGNKNQFESIKMFSLYGEWGSGKSSLMKYLEKELKGDFNTFFFEAWEFEKDENLAMSLLEFIDSKTTNGTEYFCKDVIKYGGRILRGLAKSIKVNVPLFPNGSAIEIDPSAFVGEFDNNEKLSFYEALKKFKDEFIIMEDRIKAATRKDYNIVFIDDLDRCEPEQVLNLLSAIKLFFTYGKRTIFFCGIDKKAAEEAVKTKYGEIVKANEYLEKIFDISFSMPKHNDLLKLVNNYFDTHKFFLSDETILLNKEVRDLFQALQFTNPRRVKKVLNKYNVLVSIVNVDFKLMITPDIYCINTKKGNVFETLIVLYLIILHEFYYELFESFADKYKKEIFLYTEHQKKRSLFPNSYKNTPDYLNFFDAYDVSNIPLNNFYEMINEANPNSNRDGIVKNSTVFLSDSLPIIFTPFSADEIAYHDNVIHLEDCSFVQKTKTVDNYFYDFIKLRYNYLLSTPNHSNSTFISIKEFINLAL